MKGGNGSSSGASSDTSSAPAAGSDNKAAAPAASSQPAANNAGAAAPAGGTAAAGGAVSVAAGQDLVNQNGCMGCHGQDLKGGAGPNLHGVVDRLKPEGVKEVLTKGRNSMPPLAASWTDQQKDSVVAYLKSLK
ncbi:cytochrome c [Aneurinibacillus terranovensis]|uniref:c-type cytochrome n=1 Tax=Aneurinibacillus terranovensis TaxID=278991 RepID=UPI00316AEC37